MPLSSLAKVTFAFTLLFSLLSGRQARATEHHTIGIGKKVQLDTSSKESTSTKPPTMLKGHLSQDNADALASSQSYGFACQREGSTALPARVQIVAQNSLAFQGGLQVGDRVLKADVSTTVLTMVVDRNSKSYTLRLSSVPNTFGLRTPTGASSAQHPFTVGIIRQTGPNGVLQGKIPNCWFEAALAAVAAIPQGQQVISDMIVRNPDSTFTVLFRGDSAKPIRIPQVEVVTSGLINPAPWANVIETAELKEFPDNAAADDPNRGTPKIRTGLRILTGHQSQFCLPDSTGETTMENIIRNCIQNRIPIIIATKSPEEDDFLPIVLVPNHAYALVSWDPNTKLVTLKNPLGNTVEKDSATQRRAYMDQHPGDTQIPPWIYPLPDVGEERDGVRNLGNGFVQLSIPTLQQYARYMAWSPL